MAIGFILEGFKEVPEQEALIWRERAYTYGWLAKRVGHWRGELERLSVQPGSVIALEADFSPNSLALLLALIARNCILVPLAGTVAEKKEQDKALAGAEYGIRIDREDRGELSPTGHQAAAPLYERLRSLGHPGLVLFTSGSTGESKAAVHDFVPLIDKFSTRRQAFRTIAFLLYDHIGGINTLLHVLAGGGCLVTLERREPDYVLELIERHRVELLPTTPTFLNLVLLSEAYRRHDLSSLRRITYGTEPMPASTLKRIHEVLPGVMISQTYGLTETGILRARSRSSDSLWVKVGGEDFETRIENGTLWIKARSAMLGYLNAPNPFSAEGWLDTGDLVEVDGEYLRFLGRRSEMINVGGEKVFPAEVESVILEMENVAETLVYGEKNPITGHIVCATVRLVHDQAPREIATQVKQYCGSRLERFKVPVKVKLTGSPLHTERFKKGRQPQ